MRKSNLFKTSIIFILMVVVFASTAFTAYAYDGNSDETEPTAADGQYEDFEPFNTDTDENADDGGELPPLAEEPQEPAELPYGSLVIINSTHDGQLLQGAVFALYRADDTACITETATDSTGRTREVPLPQGNYNIVVLIPANGYAPLVNVISTTITSGQKQELTIFSVPIQTQEPNPTPEPTLQSVDSGRLLLTLRAQGTGQLLGGAVYELRRAMDGEFVSYLMTDSFGEAAIDLPAGDYFIREIQAVRGFTPNNDRVNLRITANRLNEVNLTSRPEPTEEQSQPPTQQESPPQPGRLIVTLITDGTREPIQGAAFEVRRAIDNSLMAEFTTDRFGEAAVLLQPDDYFLRQLNAPQGFEFNTERVNVRIAENAVKEVSITNRRIEPVTPPEQPAGQPIVADGRLLVTVMASDSNERLEGVVYTIHDAMTDEVITMITTNAFGEASAFLQPGQYFMRNADIPHGYTREAERVSFTIRSATITTMNVTARAVPQATPSQSPTPQPTAQTTQQPAPVTPSTPSQPSNSNRPGQSRVEITTRAELSGHPLHGATFTVYRASDNQQVGEVTTDMNGKTVISLNAGEYYLRNNSVQYGFLRERSRIFFTVNNADVTVEVTIERDSAIPDIDVDSPDITIPKTGEMPPVMNYVLGTLFFALALFCGIGLLHERKQQRQKMKRIHARKLRREANAYV